MQYSVPKTIKIKPAKTVVDAPNKATSTSPKIGRFGEMPENQLCQNCEKRNASGMWTGENGMFGAIHGAYSWWCETCMVKAQLEYTKKCAEKIPQLEKRLIELTKNEG